MKSFLLVFIIFLTCVSVYPEKSEGTKTRVRSFDLSRQMSLLRAATTTRIDDSLSPANITALKGETALLVCTVINVGDKSVSWLRHHVSSPIPQLLAVNNITTTLNPRYRAVVSGAWTEFLMVIKDVKDKDSGQFECQISGPKHSSLNKKIHLQVIDSITEIDGSENGVVVERHSRLELICRVTSGDRTPAFIIWQKENKIVKFDGGETSAVKELERDSEGRHWSRLVIENIQLSDSGQYICQPAAGAPAVVTVTVHVQRETEVQAVLGEGREESVPAVTLPASAMASSCGSVKIYMEKIVNILVMILALHSLIV